MGTDIHAYVEKENKNGIWEIVKGPNPRIKDYKAYAAWARDQGEEDKALRYEEDVRKMISGEKQKEDLEKYGEVSEYYAPFRAEGWIYDNRNYSLFAILADVRNGRGFAGAKTGDGFNIIARPKGLPEDISDFLVDRQDHVEHTPSWLTARELVEFDWDQVTTRQGVVGVDQYKKFKETGMPESWSGSVGGGRVINISNEEMDLIIAGVGVNPDVSYYTSVHWDQSYRDCCSDFVEWSIPKLVELANGDLDSVRMVFWFDS